MWRSNDSHETISRQEVGLLQYQQLFSSLQEGFAVHDIICDEAGQPIDYRFCEVNPAFEKLTGLPRERLIGRTVREVMPETEMEWIVRYGEVALTGRSLCFTSYARELGRYYKVNAYCPKPGSFATLFMDVTDRMLSEENLRIDNKNLGNEMRKRLLELDQANKTLLLRNAEIASANEELIAQNEEIMAMNEEISSLNKRLEALNTELEAKIAERTEDLQAAYHELAAQVDELEKAEKLLQRNAKIQTVLREIAETAVEASSLNVMYAKIHHHMANVLPAQNLYISFVDDVNGQIIRPYCADQTDLVPLRRPLGKGLTEYFMRMGRAVHVSPELFSRLRQSGEVSLYFAPVYECMGAPLRNSKGEIFGVITIYLTEGMSSFAPDDCDLLSIVAAQVSLAIERKMAEETLVESEARYRAVIEQSPEAVLLIEPETGKILEANSRFIEQLGYDLRRDGELSLYQLVFAEPDEVRDMLELLMRQERLPLQRRLFNHRNGSITAVERSARMFLYGGQKLAVMTLHDVSDELRREQEIKRDAKLATRVQNAMLSAPADSEHLEIFTIYKPFLYVGGDLYFLDWRYGGGLLRGFLLDATGHGLGTALHTSSIHVLLREVNEQDLPLEAAMNWLNSRLVEYFEEGTFAGALGFELDLETRSFRWVCAGIPMLWVELSGKPQRLECPGMCLGIRANEKFELHVLPLTVGDSFYFMTDGLAELYACQTESAQLPFPQMINLLSDLSESSTRRDDATAICIHIRSLPSLQSRQIGWPRILRINGYGDYQRFRSLVADILEEVTGQSHSFQEVAVNEALANAMECRDGIPRQHSARLRFNKIGNRLIVRVKTSRIGFAGNAVLRRLRSHPEDMFSFGEDAPMGRGIPLMLAVTHKMMYNSEGNEVLLFWKI